MMFRKTQNEMNMKAGLLILITVLVVSINIYGQQDSQYFKYEKIEGGNVTVILPKDEINYAVAKGKAILEHSPDFKLWHGDVRVKPFQELIDSGVFSKERMRQLEEGDQTVIELTFDETGVISYVSFFFVKEKKSLLTEEELYAICQKYKGVVYELSHTRAFTETGSATVFYCQDGFYIPFKDLKY